MFSDCNTVELESVKNNNKINNKKHVCLETERTAVVKTLRIMEGNNTGKAKYLELNELRTHMAKFVGHR